MARPSLSLGRVEEDSSSVQFEEFNVVSFYANLLQKNDALPMPIAAISALCEVVSRSTSTTISELFASLHRSSAELAAASFNSISLQCGTSLFLRFLTLQRIAPGTSFGEFKRELVAKGREFVNQSGRCRMRIAEHFNELIADGSTILVHSYSRVVVASLLLAKERKKHFQVYITESRPLGLGLKTHALLQRAGIESVVILDSAVAWSMSRIDFVICGAEAVVESGGLINYIGGSQVARIAHNSAKPLYVLAESYKFTRLFPLSQYDLPSSPPIVPTAAPSGSKQIIPATPARPLLTSPMPSPLEMDPQMTSENPLLDYTEPQFVSLFVTDLGKMTPSGISDALLGIYGGE